MFAFCRIVTSRDEVLIEVWMKIQIALHVTPDSSRNNFRCWGGASKGLEPKMEVAIPFETSVNIYQSTWRHMAESLALHFTMPVIHHFLSTAAVFLALKIKTTLLYFMSLLPCLVLWKLLHCSDEQWQLNDVCLQLI